MISLRRAGTCASCAVQLEAGVEAGWDSVARTITCLTCLQSAAAGALDRGTAGISAQREYERRSRRHDKKEHERVEADRRWRENLKTEHPVVGRMVTAVVPKATARPEPQHVRAWAKGAPGEVRVGEVLESIDGIVVLHDRHVRGSRSNIDHIAVTPGGVWVVDSKRYVDSKVEFADKGGWFSRDERLIVGGRDRTKLVDGMAWQVEAIDRAAGGKLEGTDIRPALCFVESHWGLFTKHPFLVRGVAICWPESLPELLSRPGPLTDTTIDSIARAIAAALPAS